MAILTIKSGGTVTELPDPSEMSVILQDIDAASTARNAKGKLIRDRVCGGASAKRKIEVKWSYLDMYETQRIMKTIKEKFFTVVYPDTYTGEMREGTFYVGDRTVKLYRCDHDGANALMESIDMHFIEQ